MGQFRFDFLLPSGKFRSCCVAVVKEKNEFEDQNLFIFSLLAALCKLNTVILYFFILFLCLPSARDVCVGGGCLASQDGCLFLGNLRIVRGKTKKKTDKITAEKRKLSFE